MKALSKYLINREAAILFLLRLPRSEYTSGTFHKLRVEIKKLDALFDLLNSCSKDFKRRKYFKPFKQVFRQAGKVRELQVEEAMLKKYLLKNALSDYRSELKIIRLKEQEKYFSLINRRFVKRLKKRYLIVAPFISSANHKKVKTYLGKKINSIQKLLHRKTLRAPELHALRKRLKMLAYNQKSLPPKIHDGRSSKKDILPELLGKWHDCQVILGHLKKTMATGGIGPVEIQQVKKIKTKISSESKHLFSKINATIPASEFF